MAKADANPGELPLTTGTLLRWGGFVVAAIGAIVTGLWFVAGLQQHDALLEQRVNGNTTAIAELKARADASERDANAQRQQLAEALIILRRIDEKVGKP